MSDILTFLQALYGPAASLWPEWFFQTFLLGHAPRRAPQSDSWRLTQLEAAAAHLERMADSDCFVSMGIASRSTVGNQRFKKPGSAETHTDVEVERLVGVWVDVDLADPAAKRPSLPTSTAQALELVWAAPLPPTIVTLSGSGGCHAFWVYEAPEDVTTAAPAEEAWLRLVAQGHKLDSVFDAARVMRVPGTINPKNGERAALAGGELTRWVSYTAVVAAAPAVPSETTGASPLEGTNGRTTPHKGDTSDGDIIAQAQAWVVEADCDAEIDALLENNDDPRFRMAIERDPQLAVEKGWKPDDDSAYDQSMASTMVGMSVPDATIWGIVMLSRSRAGLKRDAGDKAWRLDYAKRTLRKAHDRSGSPSATKESSQQTLNL